MAYWKDDIQPKDENLRKGPDGFVRWIRFSSVFCWLMFFLTVLIWDNARPQIYSILDIHYGKTSRAEWDASLISTAFIVSIITFAYTLLSIIMNTQRIRRKNDKISISLVVCLIASGLLMIALFMSTAGII